MPNDEVRKGDASQVAVQVGRIATRLDKDELTPKKKLDEPPKQ